MATAYYGNLCIKSGNSVGFKGLYFSDAAGGVNFDVGAGASSSSSTTLQLTYPYTIVDLVSNYAVGTQSTKTLTVYFNDIRQPIQLSMVGWGKDLSTKTPLSINVPANTRLQLIQA